MIRKLCNMKRYFHFSYTKNQHDKKYNNYLMPFILTKLYCFFLVFFLRLYEAVYLFPGLEIRLPVLEFAGVALIQLLREQIFSKMLKKFTLPLINSLISEEIIKKRSK